MTQLDWPSSQVSLDEVQHLVLERAGWDLYEKLLKTIRRLDQKKWLVD